MRSGNAYAALQHFRWQDIRISLILNSALQQCAEFREVLAMKHQEGSFAMQHQNQGPSKGPTAGKTGLLANQAVITAEEIERHIAEGKRMQSEAIAAGLRAVFRRLGLRFQRRPAASHEAPLAHRA
jgi:hypothetical protein